MRVSRILMAPAQQNVEYLERQRLGYDMWIMAPQAAVKTRLPFEICRGSGCQSRGIENRFRCREQKRIRSSQAHEQPMR
ncbi:MAG: hypothetical protein C0504_19505 [Candidatus Solibacter sp.]|nr:hypothetical protein [Candidatus Solibacter sp.]